MSRNVQYSARYIKTIIYDIEFYNINIDITARLHSYNMSIIYNIQYCAIIYNSLVQQFHISFKMPCVRHSTVRRKSLIPGLTLVIRSVIAVQRRIVHIPHRHWEQPWQLAQNQLRNSGVVVDGSLNLLPLLYYSFMLLWHVSISVFRMCQQWIKVAEIEMVLSLNDDLRQSVVHCICTKAFIKYGSVL